MKLDINKPDEILKQMIRDIDLGIMKTYGMETSGVKKENRRRLRRTKARILTELNRRKK